MNAMKNANDIVKECYARFGLAYYFSECIGKEMATIYAVSGFRNNSDIVKPRIEEKYHEAFSLTTGQLAIKIKPYLSDELNEEMGEIILKRNFLAHHFWYENASRIANLNQIESVTNDLIKIANEFESFDDKLSKIFADKYVELGLTDKLIAESLVNVLNGTDEKISKQRKFNKVERLIKIWTVKVGDNKFQIFETKDHEFWGLCEIGLGWSKYTQVQDDWIIEERYNKYLPADINPRPKITEIWNYSFKLNNNVMMIIQKTENDKFIKIKIQKNVV